MKRQYLWTQLYSSDLENASLIKFEFTSGSSMTWRMSRKMYGLAWRLCEFLYNACMRWMGSVNCMAIFRWLALQIVRFCLTQLFGGITAVTKQTSSTQQNELDSICVYARMNGHVCVCVCVKRIQQVVREIKTLSRNGWCGGQGENPGINYLKLWYVILHCAIQLS